MPISLDHLRRHAVARSLFAPTTLPSAIECLGFVQADPLRAPARAQDLTLRHRVADYRAGDLEARYPQLDLEEDFFVNYGFVTPALHRLMHPRTPRTKWSKARWQKAHDVLAFVRERGVVHPREVDAHFRHGTTRNWFGGSSNASTELLDGMHYRGLLRVARREAGTRCYAAREPHAPTPDTAAALDAMVDVIVGKYAPLPARSLSQLVMFLAATAPQWRHARQAALARAKARLPSAQVAGVAWFWPAGENPTSARHAPRDEVRLLAPFDPVVWDRRRFELFWGWPYRFEAYTPAPKRRLGHYALPLLWREHVVGWANVSVRDGRLRPEVGFFGPRIVDPVFSAAVDDELHRMHCFLGLT
ncbi:MAG: winged helix DNA-binding domain-containing protein [Aquincola sp.]|nr:winged helix DNA-binding domain-containing protein [Aquincola sp.]